MENWTTNVFIFGSGPFKHKSCTELENEEFFILKYGNKKMSCYDDLADWVKGYNNINFIIKINKSNKI